MNEPTDVFLGPNDLSMKNEIVKENCKYFFTHHKCFTSSSPANDLRAIADWCDENDIGHDRYGQSAFIQSFEDKIAKLLGFEAAKFCLTGVAAQVVALRTACGLNRNSRVFTHATSHLLLHENQNSQIYNWFDLIPVGSRYRPFGPSALSDHADIPAAVLYELPMRELGGQMPDWGELSAIKVWACANNVHLHMDGARLWEAAAGYSKSLAEVCDGFDTVYVSFYKGIGALAGAMLLGKADFIQRAGIDMQRQGVGTFRQTPYVASAAMQFDHRTAQMPAYYQRTLELFEILAGYPSLTSNPSRPQCNMLHLYMPVEKDKAMSFRDEIAEQLGVWIFNAAVEAALPNQSYFEWYVGDNLVDVPDNVVREALDLLSQKVESPNSQN